MYERQEELNINIPDSVAIIGAGGIGCWTAIQAAMVGVKNIIIFDSDVIEEHNLNRLPFGIDAVGELKTDAIEKYIKSIRPDVYIHKVRNVDKDNIHLILTTNYVLDCCDSLRIQLLVSDYCNENKIKYVKGGYNSASLTITNTIPDWTTAEATDSGYDEPPTPSFVVSASTAAGFVMSAMLYSRNIDVNINLETGTVIGK